MDLEFLRAESRQTLREALLEYHGSRDDLAHGRGLCDQAQEFFRCHDTAHVVFGCSTELLNEGMVKMWSFFGTDAGIRRLLSDYNLPESQEIYATLPWGDVARTTARSAIVMPQVFVRCRRMTRRWPWAAFDRHLDTPLTEIRRDYGIDVLTVS